MEQTLERFAEVSGKTVEEGIQMIAKSVAKRLAMRTQRYGLKQGPRAESAIERQITQVWIGVNLGAYPHHTDMKRAHYAIRKDGYVRHRQFRKQKGQKWQFNISERDRDQYIREAQKKLGRAKAAWITAGVKVDRKNMTSVPAWIKRHAGSSHGKGGTSGKGLSATAEIENDTYLNSRILPDKELGAAALFGMKNGFKRIQTIIDKEVEKANRA